MRTLYNLFNLCVCLLELAMVNFIIFIKES